MLSIQSGMVHDYARVVKLMGPEGILSERTLVTLNSVKQSKFGVRDHGCNSRGEAVGHINKCSSLTYTFYGPFVVTTADNPRYKLDSLHGRVRRGPIQARQPVRY